MSSGIYQIINTKNRKVYVGSTGDLKIRKYDHFSALKANRHDNPRLQNAYNCHGPLCWSFEILEFCNLDQLLVTEQKYLDLFWDNGNKCYNIAKNAKAPGKGIPKSKETKLKMSLAKKGRKLSKEHRAKLAVLNLIRNKTVSHKEKVRQALLGNTHTLGRKFSKRTVKPIFMDGI